jgi:hypothetical protein
VEAEKRNSLIKAWEENEKAKAENKYVFYPSVISLSTIVLQTNQYCPFLENAITKLFD